MATLNFAQAYAETGNTGDVRVADGTYVFQVAEAEFRESNQGKPQFRFRAVVESGPEAKKSATQFITFTDDNPMAVRMFWVNMEQFFGFTEAYWTTNPAPEAVAAAMVGKRFEAKISGREVGDRTYDNFTGVKFLGGGVQPAAAPVPAAAPPVPAATAPAAPAAPAPPAAPAAAVPAPPAPPTAPAPPF